MEKFFFVLKAVLLSTLASTLIGALIGFVQSLFKSSHPHQILPTFMIWGILLFIVGLACFIY